MRNIVRAVPDARVTTLTAVLVLSFSWVGCGGGASTPPPPPPPSATLVSGPSPFPPGCDQSNNNTKN